MRKNGAKYAYATIQMILSRSSDTLWDVAAAEVRSRENRTDEEDAEEDAHFLTQRTVFFMGSKAGVCLLPTI